MGVLPYVTGLVKINWQSTCIKKHKLSAPYSENPFCIAKNLPFHGTSEPRKASSGPTSWASIFHHRCHGLAHPSVLWNIPEDQILELLSAPPFPDLQLSPTPHTQESQLTQG